MVSIVIMLFVCFFFLPSASCRIASGVFFFFNFNERLQIQSQKNDNWILIVKRGNDVYDTKNHPLSMAPIYMVKIFTFHSLSFKIYVTSTTWATNSHHRSINHYRYICFQLKWNEIERKKHTHTHNTRRWICVCVCFLRF